jgi:protein-L-isoaspartate O-methyltransferase
MDDYSRRYRVHHYRSTSRPPILDNEFHEKLEKESIAAVTMAYTDGDVEMGFEVAKLLKNRIHNLWPSILCWLMPVKEDVVELGKAFEGIERVVSIGCGSGFYEWFLSKCCGLTVIGIEKQNTLLNDTKPFIPRTFEDLDDYGEKSGILLMFGHDDSVLDNYLPKHPEVQVVVVTNGGNNKLATLLDIDILQKSNIWKEQWHYQGEEIHFKLYKRNKGL